MAKRSRKKKKKSKIKARPRKVGKSKKRKASKSKKRQKKTKSKKLSTKANIIKESDGSLIIKVSDKWAKQAYVNRNKYEKKYSQSIKDNDGFWRKEGKRISWFKPYTKIKDVKYEKRG